MNKINIIYCEDSYQKMWNMFVFFENEPTVKDFLFSKYSALDNAEKSKLAFENTLKFIYFIKQSKEYFYSANISNILVKPLLIYYGMASLMKAFILTKDPYYPRKVGVLRHGLSTRKLKKTNFHFLDDEIKIQKEGLLPIFYNLLTGNTLIEGSKFKIKELLSLIPELNDSYYKLYKDKKIYPLYLEHIIDNSSIELTTNNDVLLLFNNDVNKFLHNINHFFESDNSFDIKNKNNLNQLILTWKTKLAKPFDYENPFNHPLILQDCKGNYYYRYIDNPNLMLPEIIIEFLIMYNLGILCRYDTELWCEIIFTFSSEDIYIINEFINLSLRKFPNLILNNLFDEFIIFKKS